MEVMFEDVIFDIICKYGEIVEKQIQKKSQLSEDELKQIKLLKSSMVRDLMILTSRYYQTLEVNDMQIYAFYGERESELFREYCKSFIRCKLLRILQLFQLWIAGEIHEYNEEIEMLEKKCLEIKEKGKDINGYFEAIEKFVDDVFDELIKEKPFKNS